MDYVKKARAKCATADCENKAVVPGGYCADCHADRENEEDECAAEQEQDEQVSASLLMDNEITEARTPAEQATATILCAWCKKPLAQTTRHDEIVIQSVFHNTEAELVCGECFVQANRNAEIIRAMCQPKV